MQCAAHLNLGWRINVMDPDPVPTTNAVNMQPLTDGEIDIKATTINEIGEFTEEGLEAGFGQVTTGGSMTVNVFHIGLIVAMGFAMLTLM